MAQNLNPEALGATAADALRRGECARAAQLFEQLAEQTPVDRRALLGLAMARKDLGDFAAAHGALDRLLKLNWRDLPGLMLKGDIYSAQGDKTAAASYYGQVLKYAPDANALSGDAADQLRRARDYYDRYSQEVLERINAEMAAAGYDRKSSSRRFSETIEILAGTARRYIEEPLSFYFAGLPPIGYYSRDQFAWMSELEAETDAIAEEFAKASADPDTFVPYVRESKDRPMRYDNALLNSKDWSALFLVDDGKAHERNALLFPKTLAALEKTPLHKVSDRGPMALFSRLASKTHIKPHTGYLNSRLICHLPIITPGECGLRVGNETREWKRGEALIFNDTIEHEAWNKSDRERVVLLFSIWRPELTEEERALAAALMASAFGFTGGG